MGLQIGGVVMKDSVTCDCTPESLAMGSFPAQKWCEPYELKTALYEGTIFPCLNMQFYAAEKIPCSFLDDAGISQREKAMNEISMVGFAINDLMLYLRICFRLGFRSRNIVIRPIKQTIRTRITPIKIPMLSIITSRLEGPRPATKD